MESQVPVGHEKYNRNIQSAPHGVHNLIPDSLQQSTIQNYTRCQAPMWA